MWHVKQVRAFLPWTPIDEARRPPIELHPLEGLLRFDECGGPVRRVRLRPIHQERLEESQSNPGSERSDLAHHSCHDERGRATEDLGRDSGRLTLAEKALEDHSA